MTAKHAAGKNATAGVIGLESYQTQYVRSNSTGLDVHQSMVFPSAGTEWGDRLGFLPQGCICLIIHESHGAGNFMRVSLLLPHIVCGGI